MKLIIDIPEEMINLIKDKSVECFNVIHYGQVLDAIYNGTPIPDNATNGNSVIKMFCKGIVRISSRKNVSVEFNKYWWNAPYQKGGKE